MNLDDLRRDILSVMADPRKTNADTLHMAVGAVIEEIGIATSKGVTWKKLGETLTRHVGFPVSESMIRRHYRKIAKKAERLESAPAVAPGISIIAEAPFEILNPVQTVEQPNEVEQVEKVDEPKKSTWQNAANWRTDPEKMGPKCTDGQFLTAAITPDGRLFQLEHKGRANGGRGGGYGVFEVDTDGSLHLRTGSDFPHPVPAKVDAIKVFCEWARSKGYDLMGNVA